MYKKYKDAGGNPAVLCDGRQKRRAPKEHFDRETAIFLKDCVNKYVEKNSPLTATIIQDTIRLFVSENKKREVDGATLLHIPSASTIERRIKKLDPFWVMCVRESVDEARKNFSSSGEGLPIEVPFERVEIDEWKVDIFTFLEDLGLLGILSKEIVKKMPIGRRWIVVIIDCATRCILGIIITENPSGEAARKVVYQMLVDKTDIARACGCQSDWNQFGLGGLMASDTGTAFLETGLGEELCSLGIAHEFGPVSNPENRPYIERFFGTLARNLTPHLIGRSFASIQEKGNRNPADRAALTDDDLTRIMVIYIVDYYHHAPHSGLGGQTPYNAWVEKTKTFGTPPPLGAVQITAALGTEFSKKLSKKGVALYKNHYSCEALRELFKSNFKDKLRVRMHPSNIGFIVAGRLPDAQYGRHSS